MPYISLFFPIFVFVLFLRFPHDVYVIIHCLFAFSIVISRQEDELGTVERQLDDDDGQLEEGSGEVLLKRRRRGDTDKVRKLAKKLSRDVDQLKKEKEEYSV